VTEQEIGPTINYSIEMVAVGVTYFSEWSNSYICMGCAVRAWILPNFANGFIYLHCLNGHIQTNILRPVVYIRRDGPQLGMLACFTPPLLRRRWLYVATSRAPARNKSLCRLGIPKLAFSRSGWKEGCRYSWQYFSAI